MNLFSHSTQKPSAIPVKLRNTSDVPGLDEIIDGINTNLDTKLRKDITFETVADLSLALSNFNGSLGVYFEDDVNVAVTVNDDLKDGVQRSIIFKNTHGSSVRTLTFPQPRGSSGGVYGVSAGYYLELVFCWYGSYWRLKGEMYQVEL